MYSNEQLNAIYDRTSGYCHLCHKKLAFKNYASYDQRGAWEVEHSRAKANGGSDRSTNLYAACISCNRAKSTSTTRLARAKSGKKYAPLSKAKRQQAKMELAVSGSALGAAIGGIFFGPGGALIGSIAGAAQGHKINPDKFR